MEMRDPSSKMPIEAPEEQTLNHPAPAQAEAESVDNTYEATDVSTPDSNAQHVAAAVSEAAPQPDADDATSEVASDEKPAMLEGDECPELAAEELATEAVEQEQDAEQAATPTSKEALIVAAKEMLDADPASLQREAITRMRQQFNTLRKIEIEDARTAWAEQGNAPEDFVVADDPDEAAFNEIINAVRDKKNAWAAEKELERQQNLQAKNDIINQINALAEDTDNVNRTFPQYRELQDKFNAIGEVPPTEETSVWKKFQEARERYSDNLKINKELRDYDFKKNLDAKNLLIDEAKALDAEPDVIVAFRRLQELHDKWRQIGPVAKDIREELWASFKDASAAINKKYQAFFEERKAREQHNEEAKTALCEEIEQLDFSALKKFNDWELMTAKVIELQAKWKELGYASRKVNNALFARFRQRCDEFFSSKAAYFKQVKEEYAANLAKKTALAERAEALKDSTDWRKTSDEFVAMQKEWKTIGAVPKRHSDAVWKRFLAACDYFFDKKKEATSGQRSAEAANLKAKREIIDALNAIGDDIPDSEAAEKLRELQDRWQQTGHVPFRDKDKINDGYRTAVNALRSRLNIHENRARMDRFETNISQMEGDQQKLYRERERLARALEARRNDMRTYENNIGFLTSKSKSGDSMLNEMRNKMERLKADIEQIKEKISLIDSKISS